MPKRFMPALLVAALACGCSAIPAPRAPQGRLELVAAQAAALKTRVESEAGGVSYHASYEREEGGCRIVALSALEQGEAGWPSVQEYTFRFCGPMLDEWYLQPANELPPSADAPLRRLAHQAAETGYAERTVDGMLLSARLLKKRELGGHPVEIKVRRGLQVIYRSEVDADSGF